MQLLANIKKVLARSRKELPAHQASPLPPADELEEQISQEGAALLRHQLQQHFEETMKKCLRTNYLRGFYDPECEARYLAIHDNIQQRGT